MDYTCSMPRKDGSEDGSRAFAGAVAVPSGGSDIPTKTCAGPISIGAWEGRDAQT